MPMGKGKGNGFGAGGSGSASVAEDMFFTSLAERDTFTTNNPGRIEQGVVCAVDDGAGGHDYYQWSNGAGVWQAANLIFRGRQGATGPQGPSIDSVTVVGDDFVFGLDDGSDVTLVGVVPTLTGETGAGASVTSAAFSGDDIVFSLSDGSTATLPNATVELEGPQGPVGTTDHDALSGKALADQHPIGAVTGLQSALDAKVDAISGKGLSDENFTSEEKLKLAGLEGPKMKGLYATLADLETDYPLAEPGDYAFVDGGVGNPNELYVWDNSQWEKVSGDVATATPAQIKDLLLQNADTNNFGDAELAIVQGAALQTDLTSGLAGKADAVHGHVIGDVGGLQDALDSKVDSEVGKGLSTNDYDNTAKSVLDNLGTAAERDVTTSSTDLTPERLLKVGDFGLGSGEVNTSPFLNPDTIKTNTWFQSRSGIEGGTYPDGVSKIWGITFCSSESYRTQIAFSTPAGIRREFLRNMHAGVWGVWQEIYHTGNLEITNSPTDTTSGRLLKVGDFGLGGVLRITDVDVVFKSGLYRVDDNTVGIPESSWGSLLVCGDSSMGGVITQTYVRSSNGALWTRGRQNNTWSPWRKSLKVGDYGLGEITTVNSDYDVTLPVGFYLYAHTANSRPPSGGSRVTLNLVDALGAGMQIACRTVNNNIDIRSITPSAKEPWVSLLHSGDKATSSTSDTDDEKYMTKKQVIDLLTEKGLLP